MVSDFSAETEIARAGTENSRGGGGAVRRRKAGASGRMRSVITASGTRQERGVAIDVENQSIPRPDHGGEGQLHGETGKNPSRS